MVAQRFSQASIAQLIALTGRTAVVTGGAAGIGLATGRRLAEAGASVVLVDINGEKAEAEARALAEAFGGKAIGAGVDLRDETAIVALGERVVRELGQIDIWVNNAAIYKGKPSLEVTAQDWDSMHDLNLRGTFIGCREAARHMIAQSRHGVIINISSVSGFRGRSEMASYVASKHGVVGLTKALAGEWGPKDIRVLGIAPVLASTPGLDAFLAASGQAGQADSEALIKKLTANLPLGRIAEPDDIARAVLFCASDMAALVTGTTLAVDAGLMSF